MTKRLPRPLELARLHGDELVELAELLEACGAGVRAAALPWETPAGVRSLDAVRELRTTYARQSRMGNGGGGAAEPAHQRPALFVDTAGDTAGLLHGTLANLAAALMRAEAAEAPVGPRRPAPRSLEPGDLASWLLDALDRLAWHPGIVRPHLDELRRLVRKARGIVDRRAERWYAGPCNLPLRDADGSLVITATGVQARCPEDLLVPPRAKVARCRSCDGEHRIDLRRDELLRQAESSLLNAADLSRAVAAIGNLECRPDRVRQWARRGRILGRGTDAKGNPLYRVGDALLLLEADAVRAERAATKAAKTREARRA